MADRCFVCQFQPAQATGTPGEFQIVATCCFFHDGATSLSSGNAVATVTDAMTPAQMLTAMVAAIRQLAIDAGYSLPVNAILMPAMTKA
jgi:hypothetical protein